MTNANSNSTAIYGDATTATATYIPDLNSLANDPYVKITANTAEFNVWQTFFMSSNYYDTRWSEQYHTQTTTNNDNTIYTLQGNIEGWTPADEIFIEVPITLEFFVSNEVASKDAPGAGDNQQVDPITFTNFSINLLNRAATGYGFPRDLGLNPTYGDIFNASCCQDVSDLLQPDWALLHVFKRIAINGGNNNLNIGRTPSWYLEGMKFAASDDKFDAEKARLYGMWGLPVSNLQPLAGHRNDLTQAMLPTGMTFNGTGVAGNAVLKDFVDAWAKTISMTSENFGATVVRSVDQRGYYYTKQIQVPLKLGMVHHFFKDRKFLPPGFKYKIDIETNTQPQLICTMPAYGIAKAGKPNPTFGALKAVVSGAPKIVMPTHILTQPIQLQINQKWIQNPFVYNYETFETYDIMSEKMGTTFIQNIAISQQRPTQLIIQVIDTVTEKWPPETFFDSSKVQGSLGAKVNGPGSIPADKDEYIPDNLVYIQSMQITLAGRLNYYYRNEANTTNSFLPNAYDAICMQQQKDCYKAYGHVEAMNPSITTFNAPGLSSRFCITIAPGAYVNTSNMPVDQGANMISVQIVFNKKLEVGKKVQIIKKLPEQIAMDTNQNITLIMWPAIKSNTGFMIQNTINAQ